MPILNYTTKIASDKTVAEIQRLLGAKGADAIMTDYADGRASAITFRMNVSGQPISFRLPCNVKGVHAALWKQRVKCDLLQAERVAWRIVKDWIAAQVALVEAGQAQMSEVFMPYAVMRGGETMFQRFEAQAKQGLLNAAGGGE